MNKIINKYITAKANGAEGELWIYGDISDDKWYDEDVTPATIRDSLKEMGAIATLNLHINSYGGSVFAGNAIINIIDRYKTKNNCMVNAYIDGVAASMGSNIPMVADRIYMASNALMMLHKPLTFAYGNAEDLQMAIEMLDKAEETLISNYMRHFNGTEDELRQILSDETWLTADEAFDLGLCDVIVEAIPMAASAKGIVIDGVEFSADKLKEKCKNLIREEGQKMHEFDANLEQYGITAEAFAEMNVEASVLLEIANSAVNTYIENNPAPTGVVVTKEQISDALGSEMEIEEVFALAKKGSEYDEKSAEKAKQFDALVNTAIDDALANGVKAKGEAFNEYKWKKILGNLDYAEILDQSKEWADEAKAALNAGKRVSKGYEDYTQAEDKIVNPEDYKF